MLVADEVRRRNLSRTEVPTPDCLPMPLLEKMATDPRAGTATERTHVESCGFCRGMLDRIRAADEDSEREPDLPQPRPRPTPMYGRAWRLVRMPAALAACLGLGIVIGHFLPGQEAAVEGWPERGAQPSYPLERPYYLGYEVREFLERSAGPPDSESPEADELKDRYEELLQWKAEAEQLLRRVLDMWQEEAPEHDH